MRLIKLFVIVFLLTTCASLFAQKQQFEFGGMLGGAGYMGDLNQNNPLKINGISGGVFTKLNFDPHWGVSFNYNYGRIKGADSISKDQQFRDRNLSFFTPLHELSFLLDFNLFDLTAYNRKGRVTPFIFAGVGGVFFTPKTEYNGRKYELADLTTEGQADPYKPYTLTFPYGMGLRYKTRNNLTIFSQIGYRTALTDYLDDVSGVYPKKSDLQQIPRTGNVSAALSDRSGEKTGVYLGTPGSQRGDFRKRDTYLFVGIGISYTFVSQKCYTF